MGSSFRAGSLAGGSVSACVESAVTFVGSAAVGEGCGLGANFESASPLGCRRASRGCPPLPRPLPRWKACCGAVRAEEGAAGGLNDVFSSFCVMSSTGAAEACSMGTISSSKRSSSPRDCEKSSILSMKACLRKYTKAQGTYAAIHNSTRLLLTKRCGSQY